VTLYTNYDVENFGSLDHIPQRSVLHAGMYGFVWFSGCCCCVRAAVVVAWGPSWSRMFVSPLAACKVHGLVPIRQ
jgi:hypothetical protein